MSRVKVSSTAVLQFTVGWQPRTGTLPSTRLSLTGMTLGRERGLLASARELELNDPGPEGGALKLKGTKRAQRAGGRDTFVLNLSALSDKVVAVDIMLSVAAADERRLTFSCVDNIVFEVSDARTRRKLGCTLGSFSRTMDGAFLAVCVERRNGQWCIDSVDDCGAPTLRELLAAYGIPPSP